MGKTEHRKKLKARNIKKSEITLHTSGRLIEENHNGQDYTPGYVKRVIAWRFFELWMKTTKYRHDPDKLWEYFGRLREGLQTLLLHWPDESLPRGKEFWLIYNLLGMWREGKKTELTEALHETFGSIG